MNKKYSYIGISFIILLFGIYVVPKVVDRFKKADLVTFNKVPDFEFVNQNGKKIRRIRRINILGIRDILPLLAMQFKFSNFYVILLS